MLTSIFDTNDGLYDAAVRLFVAVAGASYQTPAAIIVPGGNTPKPLFERLASQPPQVSPHMYLGLTDERMVPDTDPASNYGLATAMFQQLGLPPQRVLRVDTSLDLEAAADAYEHAWQEFFACNGTIPLAFLGLGDDGHTCSLFSPEQVRECTANHLAAPVSRPQPPHRVTITPELLQRVQHVVFLAMGQSKTPVVESMTRDPMSVTAGIAVSGCPRVSLWYAPA